MKRQTAQGTLAVAAGLGLIGGLAGCATGASDAASSTATPDAGSSTATTSATPSEAASSASGSIYTDGTYSAEGSYVSPGGPETVTVELTLADDVVTAVSLTSDATNPNTKQFQGKFESGLDGAAVGKNIDELNISKLAGSSLTSTGFNEALEAIKAEARA